MPSSKVDSTETANHRNAASDVASDQARKPADPGNGDSGSDASSEDRIVTIDRRTASHDRRSNPDALDVGVVKNPRRKKQRRRHIDPTTCERDYTDPEIEFMRAMDDYKRVSGRMFPTCSEVLEVIRDLGYVRLTEEQRDALGVEEIDQPEASEEASGDEASETEAGDDDME